MEFILSHWHFILPAIAILVAVFLMSRGKSKKSDGGYGTSARDNEQDF